MTVVSRLVRKTVAYWIIWLFVVGQLTPSVLLLGLLCSGAVAWIDLHRSPPRARPFPWVRLFLYVPWLLVEVVKSGVHMTGLILRPGLPIEPQLIPYKPQLRDPAALVLLGNSITLTPGTITAEIAPDQLLFHAIDNESAQGIMDGTMEGRIAQVFERTDRGGS